jgi:hypothetical protein
MTIHFKMLKLTFKISFLNNRHEKEYDKKSYTMSPFQIILYNT